MRLHQRNVAGDHQRIVCAASDADLRGHFYGVSFAAVGVVGDDVEMELASQVAGIRIASDEGDCGVMIPRGDGFEFVPEHGLGELGAGRLIKRSREALLGGIEILDRDEDHDQALEIEIPHRMPPRNPTLADKTRKHGAPNGLAEARSLIGMRVIVRVGKYQKS